MSTLFPEGLPTMEQSIAEVRRVAKLVKETQPRWAHHLENVALAATVESIDPKATHPEAALPNDGGITLALVQMARENAIEECAKAIEPANHPLLMAATKAIRALKSTEPQKDKS